jgi:hypothetical protein
MAAPARVWIAQVEFDPEIASKVQTKHNIDPDEVREAICFGKHRRASWDEHPEYGRRLIVIGDNYAGVSIVAYLKPINEADGTWECRTAMIWKD